MSVKNPLMSWDRHSVPLECDAKSFDPANEFREANDNLVAFQAANRLVGPILIGLMVIVATVIFAIAPS
ncbi:MAG: hypothetical protein ACYTGL_19680 [Planctomycetota bacterium]|jgi:hypothetical protein